MKNLAYWNHQGELLDALRIRYLTKRAAMFPYEWDHYTALVRTVMDDLVSAIIEQVILERPNPK
jgi:hypothetical protein